MHSSQASFRVQLGFVESAVKTKKLTDESETLVGGNETMSVLVHVV